MNKVYVLSHIHKFKKESSECLYGHTDIKLIGVFYSKTTCENVLEKYKKLEGFKDTIEDFYINEYVIDSIYNSHLSELINYQVPKKDASELLYLLYFIEEFEDGHSDTKLLGVFSSQQKAENSVALIKGIPEMASIHDQFEIYENKIDQLGWKEGFVTLN